MFSFQFISKTFNSSYSPQRRGIPFSAMVLKFGNLDPQYDPAFVTEITNHASSIYFVNLVVIQFFNLLATRTRHLSIFQQPPLFNKQTQNPLLFAAMAWSLFIVFICQFVSPRRLCILFTLLTLPSSLLHSRYSEYGGYHHSPCRALLPSGRLRNRNPSSGRNEEVLCATLA